MSKKSVYEKRMMKLVKVLEEVKAKRFDFSSWVGDTWKGKADLSCGTSACALGWATTIPSLRKLGLRMFKNDPRDPSAGYVALMGSTKGMDDAPFEAAEHVFGLTRDEFYYLFVPHSPPPVEFHWLSCAPDEDATPKQVATHIRNFIKEKFKKEKTK